MPFQFGMLETIIRAHHNIGSTSIKAKNPTRKNDLNAPRIPDPSWSRIPNIQLNVVRGDDMVNREHGGDRSIFGGGFRGFRRAVDGQSCVR